MESVSYTHLDVYKRQVLHSDWSGLKNFEFLFKSNDLFVILRNTILYNVAFIVLGMFLSVGLAILISLLHSKRKSKVYQTLMFFPYFMSWVVVAYFLDAFLNQDNGLINSMLRDGGAEDVYKRQDHDGGKSV